ncbi:MAG: hypothetical protein PHR35_10935, partial [Kiritimatiellae bacterium]|nr:hypothetical protein [Kiritimatiellia bacterium]
MVRNGAFNQRGANPPYFTQANVDQFHAAGWTCPDVAEWPIWWSVYGANGRVEFPRVGGAQADGFARLSGRDIYLTGYHGYLWADRTEIYTVWARGKGKLALNVLSYHQTPDGRAEQLLGTDAVASLTVNVDSAQWVRYRRLLMKTPRLNLVHPWLGVMEGAVDMDGVDITPSTPALDRIVATEERLFGTGALIESMEMVEADGVFAENARRYRDALTAFGQSKDKLDRELMVSLQAEIDRLAPYVLTPSLSIVQATRYNEMIVLTHVLEELAGREPGQPAAIKAREARAAALGYKVGIRQARKDTVTITGIRTDKILYEEGEDAVATVFLINTSLAKKTLTLAAIQITDLDDKQEVARETVSVPAEGSIQCDFRYNVGPETFGRALEVRLLDETGKEIDRWQDYYQSAREWLRVQMHSPGRYNNMVHHFASEPTDWGVQIADVEEWRSCQNGLHVIPEARFSGMKNTRLNGRKVTFY